MSLWFFTTHIMGQTQWSDSETITNKQLIENVASIYTLLCKGHNLHFKRMNVMDCNMHFLSCPWWSPFIVAQLTYICQTWKQAELFTRYESLRQVSRVTIVNFLNTNTVDWNANARRPLTFPRLPLPRPRKTLPALSPLISAAISNHSGPALRYTA